MHKVKQFVYPWSDQVYDQTMNVHTEQLTIYV